MELGQRIREARLAAGLSQRQLCGGEITRNMLSQIENGSAKPSMATLRYLAGQLGKSISWFLEEDAQRLPNQAAVEQARAALAAGEADRVTELLSSCDREDPVYGQELALLQLLATLTLAEQALQAGKGPYALTLLEKVGNLRQRTVYFGPELQRRWLLLKGLATPRESAALEAQLPSLDGELILRARAALERGDYRRCEALLESAEDHTDVAWCLLRGEACFAQEAYGSAAEYFSRAEAAAPEQTLPKLELCWQKLEDYKMAYHYACRRRELGI